MDRFIEMFLNEEGFGPALARKEVPSATVEKFRGKQPDVLLDYWQAYGWCGYAKGLFWTVDPDEWEQELESWIGDTPFMERDSFYVIARSAFGELVLWGTNTGQSLKVVSPHGWVYPAFDEEKFKRRGPDKALQLFFGSTSRATYDLSDADGQPLFDRALAKLGPLNHETRYGFVPALGLGRAAAGAFAKARCACAPGHRVAGDRIAGVRRRRTGGQGLGPRRLPPG